MSTAFVPTKPSAILKQLACQKERETRSFSTLFTTACIALTVCFLFSDDFADFPSQTGICVGRPSGWQVFDPFWLPTCSCSADFTSCPRHGWNKGSRYFFNSTSFLTLFLHSLKSAHAWGPFRGPNFVKSAYISVGPYLTLHWVECWAILLEVPTAASDGYFKLSPITRATRLMKLESTFKWHPFPRKALKCHA